MQAYQDFQRTTYDLNETLMNHFVKLNYEKYGKIYPREAYEEIRETDAFFDTWPERSII